jgi:tripartite-type tricarboxylate transporter receptor subunit TctC
MEFPRRTFLRLATGAAAMPALPRFACAQSYPSRPVHIIVGFAAGGAQDIVARLVGQFLSERLGRPFIIDNRPGATGSIGVEAAARASPDGYTLVVVSASNTINATLHEVLSRDIAPVAGLVKVQLVMEVNTSFPAHSVPEFIAYAKANPGKISFASSGVGNSLHVAGELFKMMAGVDMVHVPYRGSAPALTDLLGGQVQVMFVDLPSSIGYVRVGKLRALAVTTASHAEALPDLPSVGDFLPGYEVSGWFGIGAPRNTPAEIINKLNKEINATLADPKMKVRLGDLGATTFISSSADFGKLIADETEKWAKVIKFARIKAD